MATHKLDYIAGGVAAPGRFVNTFPSFLEGRVRVGRVDIAAASDRGRDRLWTKRLERRSPHLTPL